MILFRTLNSLDELKFGEFITRVGMNFPVSHELDNCPWNICVTAHITNIACLFIHLNVECPFPLKCQCGEKFNFRFYSFELN